MSEWIPIDKDYEHIAREKARARSLRKSQWWKKQIARGVCYYCKEKFKADELTMDHIVPLARGGKSTHGNVVPSCKSCNSKKKYLTPAEIKLAELKIRTKN